jgi:hypothetical protein
MIKFVPELKPHLMVVYLKILESWMVVFGLNQIWSSFGYDLNFKFSRAHSSASFFLSLMRTRCSSAAMRAARCCTASTAAAYYSCCRRLLPRKTAHTTYLHPCRVAATGHHTPSHCPAHVHIKPSSV